MGFESKALKESNYKRLQPTFRTLSITTSQKRKMPESKYLSRGVSWRQAAAN